MAVVGDIIYIPKESDRRGDSKTPIRFSLRALLALVCCAWEYHHLETSDLNK